MIYSGKAITVQAIDDGIAELCFDLKDDSVNKFNALTVGELKEATAAIAAYPELGVEGHGIDKVPASWGIYHNVFNLEESTFEFLEAVLAEVVELFPAPFIHLGGDEVVIEQWEGSPRVAERMRSRNRDEQESQHRRV